MAINKKCKQCNAEFEITDDDLGFLDKVSPSFADKKFAIPAPALCYKCRLQRRFAWRNERNLFLRPSSKSGKPIVAAYPEDSIYKIFSQDEWWADDWDAMEFGADYDPSEPFFEQLFKLQKKVPRIALINVNSENSDYTNQAAKNKNCYMSFDIGWCENALYSKTCYSSKDMVDCFNCRDHCSFSYECIDCGNTNQSTNCVKCHDVFDCHFCYRIKGCRDCILCSNMQNKQYYIQNKEYTKEEYLKKKEEIGLGLWSSREKLKKEFEKLIQGSVHKFATMFKCEACSGDNLSQCKNLQISFGANRCEDGKYLFYSEGQSDSYDDNFSGGEGGAALNYETIGCYMPYNSKFIFSSWTLSNSLYCNFCHSIKDCFGCVGIRNKQYCILNKQYSKDEYEKLVAKIIEKMQADREWGEFFPTEHSPLPYNLSMSGDYFPLTKDKTQAKGYGWKDKTDTLIPAASYDIPDGIKDVGEDILQKVLVCEVSKRPYKIQPQELAFYIQQNIPIPHRHPEERYEERFRSIDPLELYHRQCMNEGCKNEFETTYAPERPEKVYCESCYQKTIV